MRKKTKFGAAQLVVLTLIAVFVLAASFSMTPKKANAVPAFAQKYHYACSVCHTVFPNLNPFGRAFWRNGFRLPGTDGTPADATQISAGLSLPNPWPVPIMVEGTISYEHITNENVSPSTDAFGAGADIVDAGAFPLYNPLFNSLSFYVHIGIPGGTMKQVVASLNGLGYGFGIPSHLFNLKLGQVTTASPYFYRQLPSVANKFVWLNVGYDGEAGHLIHARNPGFALYGTPGYHLWYKVTVTNDEGKGPACSNYIFIFSSYSTGPCGVGTASGGNDKVSNAIEYSYQLKEYMPTSMGQFELGYYGATVAEPITVNNIEFPGILINHASWTNRIMINGIDADLANDVWELGATYMVQSDSNPYSNNNSVSYTLVDGSTASGQTNGYSTFEIYGRYILPIMNNGIMLSAAYGQFSWTHKDLQEGFMDQNTGLFFPNICTDNAGLYQNGTYIQNNGCETEGIKDAFGIEADINLALNAHLFLGYGWTNEDQNNGFETGLDFAF